MMRSDKLNYSLTLSKEYEPHKLNYSKIDYVNIEALKNCRDTYFNSFEYRCDCDVEFTDIKGKSHFKNSNCLFWAG